MNAPEGIRRLAKLSEPIEHRQALVNAIVAYNADADQKNAFNQFGFLTAVGAAFGAPALILRRANLILALVKAHGRNRPKTYIR